MTNKQTLKVSWNASTVQIDKLRLQVEGTFNYVHSRHRSSSTSSRDVHEQIGITIVRNRREQKLESKVLSSCDHKHTTLFLELEYCQGSMHINDHGLTIR